jgi:hypothetical protein
VKLGGLDQRCEAGPVDRPSSWPANRLARSTLLVSISMRPSSRKRTRPSQWRDPRNMHLLFFRVSSEAPFVSRGLEIILTQNQGVLRRQRGLRAEHMDLSELRQFIKQTLSNILGGVTDVQNDPSFSKNVRHWASEAAVATEEAIAERATAHHLPSWRL